MEYTVESVENQFGMKTLERKTKNMDSFYREYRNSNRAFLFFPSIHLRNLLERTTEIDSSNTNSSHLGVIRSTLKSWHKNNYSNDFFWCGIGELIGECRWLLPAVASWLLETSVCFDPPPPPKQKKQTNTQQKQWELFARTNVGCKGNWSIRSWVNGLTRCCSRISAVSIAVMGFERIHATELRKILWLWAIEIHYRR